MTAIYQNSSHGSYRRGASRVPGSRATRIGTSATPFVCLILFVAGVAALLCVYLCQCARTVEAQYELCRLKGIKATLERQSRALQIEVTRLSSLERIETIARRDLGMVQPPMRMVIDLTQPALQASLEEKVAVATIRR